MDVQEAELIGGEIISLCNPVERVQRGFETHNKASTLLL